MLLSRIVECQTDTESETKRRRYNYLKDVEALLRQQVVIAEKLQKAHEAEVKAAGKDRKAKAARGAKSKKKAAPKNPKRGPAARTFPLPS